MLSGYLERITNIMPAPGWRAVGCWVQQNGVPHFEEIAVVGWAGIQHVPIDGQKDTPPDDDVKLLLFDEETGDAYTRDWLLTFFYKAIEILPPGKDLDADLKAQMVARVKQCKQGAA